MYFVSTRDGAQGRTRRPIIKKSLGANLMSACATANNNSHNTTAARSRHVQTLCTGGGCFQCHRGEDLHRSRHEAQHLRHVPRGAQTGFYFFVPLVRRARNANQRRPAAPRRRLSPLLTTSCPKRATRSRRARARKSCPSSWWAARRCFSACARAPTSPRCGCCTSVRSSVRPLRRTARALFASPLPRGAAKLAPPAPASKTARRFFPAPQTRS